MNSEFLCSLCNRINCLCRRCNCCRCCCRCECPDCPEPPIAIEPYVLGWARSSEEVGHVPGARIPVFPPADGDFHGWDYDWVRANTLLEYFDGDEMYKAAYEDRYTPEVLGTNERLLQTRPPIIDENHVWDGGHEDQFFRGYHEGAVAGGWASWANVDIPFQSLLSPQTRENIPGVYTEFHYSLRRFTSYLDVDLNAYSVKQAHIISDFPAQNEHEYIFPLNDSIFVFVNGKLAYWTSSDLIGSGNVAQERSSFMGIKGTFMNKDEARFPFTDGWYLTLGGSYDIANIAPYLRHGKNVVDIIADDYYFGGGMSKIEIKFKVEENE